MIVTSTNFQQNVGYYLQLADQGEKVEIEKSRPKKARYILQSAQLADKGVDDGKNAEGQGQIVDPEIAQMIKQIKSLNLTSEIKDGVKLQREIRRGEKVFEPKKGFVRNFEKKGGVDEPAT